MHVDLHYNEQPYRPHKGMEVDEVNSLPWKHQILLEWKYIKFTKISNALNLEQTIQWQDDDRVSKVWLG